VRSVLLWYPGNEVRPLGLSDLPSIHQLGSRVCVRELTRYAE
jgi:hypothetical protein